MENLYKSVFRKKKSLSLIQVSHLYKDQKIEISLQQANR